MSCVFCDIVKGDAPAQIVAQWDDAIAFVPLNPVTDGHTLVVPREHVANAHVKPWVTGAVMRRAAAYWNGPCNIITSVGVEATQTVFHLHVHVVPRRRDDGLHLPWTDQG